MPRRFVTDLLIALLCLIWGSTWIVIRQGLVDLPPFTSAGVRFVLAAIVMTAVVALWGGREGGKRPARWLTLVVGLTNFGASYAIVYWSEMRLPSGLVSVLWSVSPMLMAVSGHLFLPGETLRARQWLGFVVGFAGVALLFATDLTTHGEGSIAAALILCVSPLVSAVGTTLFKRHGEASSSLLLNRDAMWIGAVVLCAAAWWTERDIEVHWTIAAALSVAYLAVFGTAVAFGLYFWLLRHTPAHRLSLIAYVTPAIALLLGGVMRETPITRYTLAGSGLILAGVALVVRGHGATPRAAVEARAPRG